MRINKPLSSRMVHLWLHLYLRKPLRMQVDHTGVEADVYSPYFHHDNLESRHKYIKNALQ